MKFLIGLVIGAIATLLLATLADYRWQPPTRLAAGVAPDFADFADAAADEKAVAVPDEPDPVDIVVEPDPVRSVTIAPLPALAEPEQIVAPPELPAVVATSFAATASAAETVVGGGVDSQAEALATAVVWKPFHSEVSATGFARRLSTQLGYPFRALREGPARYHVVFTMIPSSSGNCCVHR